MSVVRHHEQWKKENKFRISHNKTRVHLEDEVKYVLKEKQPFMKPKSLQLFSPDMGLTQISARLSDFSFVLHAHLSLSPVQLYLHALFLFMKC